MSDRFYGAVRFSAWATKYLPKDADDCCLELEPSSKVLCFEEEEARDGKPWLVADLDILGIPYDLESSEYFEYKGEKAYSRFRAGGKSEGLIVTNGDELVEAKDIVSMIDKGNNLAAIRRWCQDTLDQIAPLTPPLEEITEADYLCWVKSKARIFREHLWALRDGHETQVGDMYLSIVPDLQAGAQTLHGLPGLLVTRPVAKGRLVTGISLDEGERLCPNTMFFMADKRTAAVFLPFGDGHTGSLADVALSATEYLEYVTGNADAWASPQDMGGSS